MSPPVLSAENWLIDLDGVLYTGSQPLPGAAAFITWLRDRGRKLRLVSNNATRRPDQYVTKLGDMGIWVEEHEVFTSALATALYLEHLEPRPRRAYVVGETGLMTALEGIGIELTDRDPDFVIAGLDHGFNYEKLTAAALAIRSGARFVGTNPDVTLPSERGLLPGAGSILAAIQTATGVSPTIIGKPQPLMLRLAMEQMGADPDRSVMLGDRLDTDIQGAAAAGIGSIMVLTGVSTREDLRESAVQPDLVVEDLPDLMRLAEHG